MTPALDWNALDDAQKNTLFAKYCTTWREAFPANGPAHIETLTGGILLPYRWVNEETHQRLYDLPDFLHDFNAVLPWLEKHLTSFEWYPKDPFGSKEGLMYATLKTKAVIAIDAPTFNEAAMLALLRAAGVEIKE